jgi:peptide/nickel transport system permease protein
LRAFLVRRVVFVVPTFLAVTLLAFALIHIAPGDPITVMLGSEYTPQAAAELRAAYGLDRPLLVQYALWLKQVASGHLGRSVFEPRSVASLIRERAGTTLVLAAGSMVVAIGLGVPLGVVAAVRRDSPLDHLTRVASVAGISMPVFWLALLLIVLFAVRLNWFPPGGSMAEYGYRVMVLPALALGLSLMALIARITRSTLLEALFTDYVRTARAKGLSGARVIWRHALRNSLLPLVTVVGLQVGALLGGAVLTETVFALPGLGRLLIDSIAQRDYPMISGVILTTTAAFVLVNFVVDVLYAVLDPRIRTD